MIVLSVLFTLWLAVSPEQSPAPPASSPSACLQALAAGTGAAAGEMCLGEEAARLAAAAPKDSTEWTRQWEAAAEHYRRAVNLSLEVEVKARGLNLLAQAYDPQHLRDADLSEQALRELIRLTPEDLAPMYRLAKSQEDRGLIDTAESVLLDARHRQPDDVEPNRMLAQFYARRVTALHTQGLQQERQSPNSPGQPDENGVYRVGGSVTPPARVGTPQYPPDARAAGINGNVIAEIVVDTSGNVTAAKIVRSIPLLDEAALEAVRNWRYAPTVVNGQPVPVSMTVTVNFTLPSASPPQAPPAPPRR